MIKTVAWHAATVVASNQDMDGESDDRGQEDSSELDFGDDYPGAHFDPLQVLASFLRHRVESHRGIPPTRQRWRGLSLACGNESYVSNLSWKVNAAAKAGFNVIRLSIGQHADSLGSSIAALAVCENAGVEAVLDLTGWSLRSRGGQQGLRASLGRVACAAEKFDCICGVALPRTPW